LVSIDDPLGEEGDLPLLLGSFVDVAITARPIEDAVRLPRAALRNGREVYVMNDQSLLEIREVEIAWTEPDVVLITGGLAPGERIVTSRIATPVPNMPLRTAEPAPAAPAPPPEPSAPAAQAAP
jgi:hypothetical protein